MIHGCMKSIPAATPITLTKEEHAELEGLARSTKTEHRLRQRARIVLLSAEGLATRAIGREGGCTTGTAAKWRGQPTGRGGGLARWNGPLIAKALGDVDVQYVWRFLRTHKIDLAGRKSWCESNDPDFAAKAAAGVGLYMKPPENAIFLAVDEKPSIQALERSQGYLKMPNGRALTGQSHDYTRHGTTTLFAAFDIATGKMTGRQYKRRRRLEFLDFMNRVVAQNAGREIQVILDNLNTHKPKNDRWLKRHANVHFHFTPTRASYQVEIWFSILAGKALRGASFNSLDELKAHIDAFIETYNETACPSEWTASEVHQKRLKPRFADQ